MFHGYSLSGNERYYARSSPTHRPADVKSLCHESWACTQAELGPSASSIIHRGFCSVPNVLMGRHVISQPHVKTSFGQAGECATVDQLLQSGCCPGTGGHASSAPFELACKKLITFKGLSVLARESFPPSIQFSAFPAKKLIAKR